MPLTAPEPIDTERSTLRLLREADLPALMRVNGDDEVTRFLPYASWRSLDDAQAWYRRMQNIQATGTALQFVVVERTSDEAVGTCLVFRHDEGSARAELGYALARRCWGSGLMAEALRALIAAAFGPIGLRRLEAEINPRNLASAALVRRLGFVREGLARERWINKGVPTDVELYGLLRDDGLAPRQSTPSNTGRT